MQELFDSRDMSPEVVAESAPAARSPRDDAGEAGVLPHPGDAGDPPPSPEEVPALLSTWPPRRSG